MEYVVSFHIFIKEFGLGPFPSKMMSLKVLQKSQTGELVFSRAHKRIALLQLNMSLSMFKIHIIIKSLTEQIQKI